MRIASFFPAATEWLYALGLGADIVGVSHECDYPAEARALPCLIRPLISDRGSSAEIDAAVRSAVAAGKPLYAVDAQALRALAPELIVTQSLCSVCAVSDSLVQQALGALDYKPHSVSLHPHSLEEVFRDLRLLGHATNRNSEARALSARLTKRIEAVQKQVAECRERPTVFCLEWLSPLMASGHWVPEMVELAGGREVLGRSGAASRYVTSQEVAQADAEVLILMPCGFSIERTRRELAMLAACDWWQNLSAVKRDRVALVDGNSFFSRPGPRLLGGIELLAAILHPKQCAPLVTPDSSVYYKPTVNNP